MEFLTAVEVKKRFLAFFQKNEHQIIPKSSILPHNDPTLLFINSGMAPMKSFFVGSAKPPHPRLTNVQPCIRTVDIEDVGDSYHGSSFRMMGSWSFGDYFKTEAIRLAFQLVTEEFGFPANRLYVTVLKSNDSLPDIPSDEESANVWQQFLPSDHIIWAPPEDNFWGPPGSSGPCGPCTEIFFDRGPEYGTPSGTDTLVQGRHIEIFNAGVFMEYYMDEVGNISSLPKKCVYTGAGMERFAMILQNRQSIHEIDQYEEPYEMIFSVTSDTRMSRIILDHLKSSLLIMNEGVLPSNQREAYILRRFIRRMLSLMSLADIELDQLINFIQPLAVTLDEKDEVLPHLDVVQGAIKAEIANFNRILRSAKKHLDRILEAGTVKAETIFMLKTAMGVPEDLVRELCIANGIEFPQHELELMLTEHREKSRAK